MVKKSAKKRTTPTTGTPYITVTIVDAYGSSVLLEVPSTLPVQTYIATLTQVTPALLRLFAVIDDVMSEDDALHPARRQMGMGRIYRIWKTTREELDPDYDRQKDHRLKKRIAQSPL